MPRIHKNEKDKSIVILTIKRSFRIEVSNGRVKKNTDERSLIIIILVYSAIKIKAKAPLLYSVLKPETSSDSPSAKSNGVRLVSARDVVNQTRNRGINIIIMGI